MDIEAKLSTDRGALDIRTLLGERSYRVYQMRTNEKKSFREIGEAVGLSRNRAHQIYQASIKRIELKKCGGENKPEYSLSGRALHCIYRTFGKTNVTKNEVIRALKGGKLRPGGTYGYGWKTNLQVCEWAGVSPEECEVAEST